MRELDSFYERLTETMRSTLLALRDIILKHNACITPEWKYKTAFFYYKGKLLCYFGIDSKNDTPYIGFVDGIYIQHSKLVQGDRKMIKILPIVINKDLPVTTINKLLDKAITYKETK